MNGLFTEVWAGKETISVDHAVEITLPVWVFLRLSNLSPIIFSHANILNLRLLSLSLVLQVISVFCFFFRHNAHIWQGFGQKMSWHEDKTIPKGHRMSMKDALHLVSTGTPVKVMLPDWSLKFTKYTQNIKIAYDELQVQRLHSFMKGPLKINLILNRCICLKWSGSGKFPKK